MSSLREAAAAQHAHTGMANMIILWRIEVLLLITMAMMKIFCFTMMMWMIIRNDDEDNNDDEEDDVNSVCRTWCAELELMRHCIRLFYCSMSKEKKESLPEVVK